MDVISVIVPFLNEEDCILQFCEHIDEFSDGKPFLVETIFVDDGSTDSTCGIIEGYEFKYCQNVKLIKLSKNFGSHAAVRAGLLRARGDYTVALGADLQHPDDMVSVMYENIIKGYDIVYVEKRSGGASGKSSVPSRIYGALMRRFAVKDYKHGGSAICMYSRKIRDRLNENIETNSSLGLQILNMGFKSTTVRMDFKARATGASKWTLSKKIKLFIDSFVAFSYAPLRFVSIIGFLMFFAGIINGLITIISRLINPDMAAGFATISSLLAIGFGVTNISLGIIAEYLWRTFDAARGRPMFIVSEIAEVKKGVDEINGLDG